MRMNLLVDSRYCDITGDIPRYHMLREVNVRSYAYIQLIGLTKSIASVKNIFQYWNVN